MLYIAGELPIEQHIISNINTYISMYIILLPIIHSIIGSREMLMQSEKTFPQKINHATTLSNLYLLQYFQSI